MSVLDIEALAEAVDAALQAGGTPERAEKEKAYLKSELRHYGTSVPAIRAVAKATAGEHADLTHDGLVALVERHPELGAVLDRWAVDEEFWLRRSALLALLVALREGGGDFDRFGRYADAMLEEREFSVRKAIGWVLRDTARKRPDLVYEWLLPRAGRASSVTIREAVKPLSATQRAAILGAKASPVA